MFRLKNMFVYTHRVTYAECTIGDHIYHSRYLDLLEAARGEFLRSLGTTVLHWQENDAIFPIVEVHLRYKYPARYDDLLAIEVKPTLIDKIRVNFGHRVLNQNGKLILDGETFHVCTSREEKPKRVPEELVEKMRQHFAQ
jgi:acyl-CoA thioester hydrolase